MKTKRPNDIHPFTMTAIKADMSCGFLNHEVFVNDVAGKFADIKNLFSAGFNRAVSRLPDGNYRFYNAGDVLNNPTGANVPGDTDGLFPLFRIAMIDFIGEKLPV